MDRFMSPTQSHTTKLINRRSSLSKKNASTKTSAISIRDQQLIKILGNQYEQNAANCLNESLTDLKLQNKDNSGFDENLPPKEKIDKHQLSPSCRTPPKEFELNPENNRTPKRNPCIVKIQRDLNSPSANTRIRALRALKSPTQINKYCNFDIPYEEQDIITAEERKTPPKPKTIHEVFQDVVVYVEVRTGGDNRSSGIKKVIAGLGATVNDKFLRNTTHVIFKDGLLSTFNKARKWNIPLVSILWIEATKKFLRLANPIDYPIFNIHKYENPDINNKIRKYKSMQPDAEKFAKKKLGKPQNPQNPITANVLIVSPPQFKKSNADNLNEILQEFQDIIGTPDQDPEVFPTNSKFLERIRNLQFEKKQEQELLSTNAKTSIISSVSGDFTPPTKNNTGNQININSSSRKSLFHYKENDLDSSNQTIHKNLSDSSQMSDLSTKRVTRRNSMLLMQQDHSNDSIEQLPVNDVIPKRITRRTSMISIPETESNDSSDFVNIKSHSTNSKINSPFPKTVNDKTPKNTRRKTIFEFSKNNIIVEETRNDLIKNNTNEILINKQTDNIQRNYNKKRETIYTPQSMDKTNLIPSASLSLKVSASASLLLNKPKTSRRTLYTTNNFDFYDKKKTDKINVKNIFSNIVMKTEIVTTPTLKTFTNELSNVVPLSVTSNNKSNDTPILNKSEENLLNETPKNKAIISFNSKRTPVSERRRTIYDYSRDIIENRLNELNRSCIKSTSIIKDNLNDNSKNIKNLSDDNSTESGSVPETIFTINSTTKNSIRENCDNMNLKNNANSVVLSQGKQEIMDSYFKQLCKTPPDNHFTTLGNKKRKLFNPFTFNDLETQTTPFLDKKMSISKILKNVTKSQSEKKSRLTQESKDFDLITTQLTKKPKLDKNVIERVQKIEKQNTPIKRLITSQLARRRSTMDFDMVRSYRSKIEKKQLFPCLVYTNMHQAQIDVIKEKVAFEFGSD